MYQLEQNEDTNPQDFCMKYDHWDFQCDKGVVDASHEVGGDLF